jgi:hypothetical protein
MPTDPTAHLMVIADHVERYFHEVGDPVPSYRPPSDDAATVGGGRASAAHRRTPAARCQGHFQGLRRFSEVLTEGGESAAP